MLACTPTGQPRVPGPSMGNHYAGFLPPAACRWDVRPTYYSPDVAVIHHCLPAPTVLWGMSGAQPLCLCTRTCTRMCTTLVHLRVCLSVSLFFFFARATCNCESFFYVYAYCTLVCVCVCGFINPQACARPSVCLCPPDRILI